MTLHSIISAVAYSYVHAVEWLEAITIKGIIMANDRRIKCPTDYDKHFPHRKRAVTGGDKAERAALDKAWEIRNFEIELYWKRALYFWAFVAAAGTGYGVLALKSEDGGNVMTADLLSLAVASVGLVCSFAWYLVNRASKYWQENWERHVGALEDKIMGPLYKTTLAKDYCSYFNPVSGYYFSISKINIMVSLFITVIWCVLFLWTLDGLCYIRANWPFRIGEMPVLALAILLLPMSLAVLKCLCKCRGWKLPWGVLTIIIILLGLDASIYMYFKYGFISAMTLGIVLATIVAICSMYLAVGGFQKSDAWEIKFVHVDVTDSEGRKNDGA